MIKRILVWGSLLFAAIGQSSAGVLQLRLQQTQTNGGSRKADSYYEMAGMTGFSVPLDLATGRYYLWATTNVNRKAWWASGADMWDLEFPVNGWPTPLPCDPARPPLERDPKCGDAAGVWYKSTLAGDGNWTYDNTTGGATTIFGFATPSSWPYQWPGDVPDYTHTGFPGGKMILSADSLNSKIQSSRISPKIDCRRDDVNPGYLATGASNAKTVKVGGIWYIAANKSINEPSYDPGNMTYGWTAGDTLRIIWGTSSDGKTLDSAQELLYGIGEDLSCSSGLLLEELFVDSNVDGNYFYLLAQPLYENYLLLFRAPVSPPPASRAAWQMLTATGDPTVGSWTAVPANGVIDYNALNLMKVMESGYGGNKQASIARVFTSSAANSLWRYIGITHRQGGEPFNDNVPELWMTSDLTHQFDYQSDIRTDRIPTKPNLLPENGWEFAFDGFSDNTTATPRITGNEFDFWLRAVINGLNRSTPDGQTWKNVVYRSTGTLSGDIFAPRVALRTAVSVCPAYVGTGTNPCYVGALNGGGGEVNAKGSPVGDWETITVVDLTRGGNTIQSGDQVNLQVSNGMFISAVNGGGSSLTANREHGDAWETYTILKVNGSGTVNSGDAVAFRSYDGLHYIGAANGGGGLVNSNGSSIGSNETFTYLPQ